MPKVRKPHDIERDRDIFQHLRLMEGDTNAEASRKTGVSAASIARLRMNVNDGGTRFPHNVTLQAIRRGYGMRTVMVPIDDRTETRRRLTPSNEIRLH